MAASLRLKGMLKLLRKEPLYCAVVNRYANPDTRAFLNSKGCEVIPNLSLECYIHGLSPHKETPFPPSPQTKDKLLYYYIMDVSSLIPVLALSPEPDHGVLDLCSAPGGKAFAFLQLLTLGRMKSGGAALNDVSYGRLKRLKEVVGKCLPKEIRNSVRFTQRRAEDWACGVEENTYDRVLVDVPCSSDRHNSEEWAKKGIEYPRTKQFGDLQEKILLAALHTVKADGRVVYSTCTLSEMENDNVVLNTLRKAEQIGISCKILPTSEVLTRHKIPCNWSRTKTGVLVSPTETYNCGPMFTCLLQKTIL